MKSRWALGKAVLSKLAVGERAKTAARITAKGAFLVAMALMIVTYAVAVSQSAAPPPEPLPPFIYS